MAKINFGGVQETVITRKEFPMARAKKVLKHETIAILGYGVPGPAQALNLKDNGFRIMKPVQFLLNGSGCADGCSWQNLV